MWSQSTNLWFYMWSLSIFARVKPTKASPPREVSCLELSGHGVTRHPHLFTAVFPARTPYHLGIRWLVHVTNLLLQRFPMENQGLGRPSSLLKKQELASQLEIPFLTGTNTSSYHTCCTSCQQHQNILQPTWILRNEVCTRSIPYATLWGCVLSPKSHCVYLGRVKVSFSQQVLSRSTIQSNHATQCPPTIPTHEN